MQKMLWLGLFLMLLVPCNAKAEDPFGNVEIKVTHVNASIYMLEGQGGNIAVCVGDDGVLMIDDQFAPLSDKIMAAIKSIRGHENVELIVNTHWHPDHTGGNENFGQSAHIIAHENVRKRLQQGHFIEFLQKDVPSTGATGLPHITYLSEQFIYLNGEEISVTHFPSSHTDGDSTVYFKKANVLHMGDMFFNKRFPFVDLSSGGNIQGLIQSIEKIVFDLPPGVRIIPGHGPLGSLEELKDFYQMLQETTSVILAEMQQGITLDDILAKKPLEKWESWGGGFISTDKWIELIYQSYQSELPTLTAL